jgi:hypothetical protein
VLSFSQTDDQVDVVARGPDGTDTTVDRSALIAPSDRFHFVPGGRVVIDGPGEIPAMFYRTEQGVFNLLPHNPDRPLVNTAEREDHPAGNFPGPGAPMTLAEMEDSIEWVLGVRLPPVPPPEGRPACEPPSGSRRPLTTGDGHTRRLAELLRDGRPLLLDLTGGNELAVTAELWDGRDTA